MPVPASKPDRDPTATHRQWTERLNWFRRSCQTVARFYRVEGVSEPSFDVWKQNLTAASPAVPPPPTVVPIRLTAPPLIAAGIELALLGEAVVHFPPGVTPDMTPDVTAAVVRRSSRSPGVQQLAGVSGDAQRLVLTDDCRLVATVREEAIKRLQIHSRECPTWPHLRQTLRRHSEHFISSEREDRGVRGQPGDRKLLDVAAEHAAGQKAAGDVVEPEALAHFMELLDRFRDFNPVTVSFPQTPLNQVVMPPVGVPVRKNPASASRSNSR